MTPPPAVVAAALLLVDVAALVIPKMDARSARKPLNKTILTYEYYVRREVGEMRKRGSAHYSKRLFTQKIDRMIPSDTLSQITRAPSSPYMY